MISSFNCLLSVHWLNVGPLRDAVVQGNHAFNAGVRKSRPVNRNSQPRFVEILSRSFSMRTSRVSKCHSNLATETQWILSHPRSYHYKKVKLHLDRFLFAHRLTHVKLIFHNLLFSKLFHRSWCVKASCLNLKVSASGSRFWDDNLLFCQLGDNFILLKIRCRSYGVGEEVRK